MELIKTIKTTYNVIYIYKINNELFVFKPSNKIKRELLANKLAKLLGINVLEIMPTKINNRGGIITKYLENAELLSNYKKKLNINQIKQLKKIIMFDIWIGNKDRHTANIFINDNLIPFDHEKIFLKGRGRNFIKLDVGRKLNKNYVEIIEKLLDKKLTTLQALKRIGFTESDFIDIKDSEIKKVVKDKKILNFLISRKDFSNIIF